MPPDWALIRRVTRIVSDPRWGGGVARDHLAVLSGQRPTSREFRTALAIAYRLGWVDFCAGYVVPGRGSDGAPVAVAKRTG